MTKMYIDRAVVEQALEFVTSEAWGTTPYMDVRVYEDAARLRDVLQAALRAAPESQLNLVPLTEDEIYHATRHCGVSKYTAINITRAVEQAHGIKE